MIILSHYKLLINTELLTALLPIFGGRAAMWVKIRILYSRIILDQKSSDSRPDGTTIMPVL
jgi:hypothetical protein